MRVQLVVHLDTPTSGLTSFLYREYYFHAINYAGALAAAAGVYNCTPTLMVPVLLVTINALNVIGGVQIVSSGGGYLVTH